MELVFVHCLPGFVLCAGKTIIVVRTTYCQSGFITLWQPCCFTFIRPKLRHITTVVLDATHQ